MSTTDDLRNTGRTTRMLLSGLTARKRDRVLIVGRDHQHAHNLAKLLEEMFDRLGLEKPERVVAIGNSSYLCGIHDGDGPFAMVLRDHSCDDEHPAHKIGNRIGLQSGFRCLEHAVEARREGGE